MVKYNLVGKRFGRLTVINQRREGEKYSYYTVCYCKCDCGNYHKTRLKALTGKTCRSCGCLLKEYVKAPRPQIRTHGKSKTKVFIAWVSMVQRCTNPKAQTWRYYGGRGIKVCKKWMKFENFYKDMGEPPTKNHSLDRIDNSKNYCKSNCRWATKKEQQNNTRYNHIIELPSGEKLTISQASERFNIHRKTISCRLKRNWDVMKALTTQPLIPRALPPNSIGHISTEEI